MKIFRNIVLAVGVLIVLAVVVACVMPNRFSVRRSRVIGADAGTLYAKFAAPRTWAEWSTWTTRGDSTLHYTYEGPDSGVGAAMKWTSKKFGDGKLTISEANPARDVRYELQMAGSDMHVHGHVSFQPAAGGTQVTWHDQGDFGANPLWRLFGPMMDGMLGSSFEKSLATLAATTTPH